MAATDEIVIFTSINEEEKAQEYLVDLVSDGLILSGTYWPVRIVFQWEGEIHVDEEYRIMMKAREGYFKDIEKYIIEHHTYRAPEIVRVSANFGSETFRNHIMSNKTM